MADLTLGPLTNPTKCADVLSLTTSWKEIDLKAGVSALYLNKGVANFRYSHDKDTELEVNTSGYSIGLWSQNADGNRTRKVYVKLASGGPTDATFEVR